MSLEANSDQPVELESTGETLVRQLGRAALFMPAFVAVYFLAYWLRFEGGIPLKAIHLFQTTVVLVVLIKVVTFAWFRVFLGWSRYLTFHDLLTLCQATVCASILTAVVDYMFLPQMAIPRSVFLMDWGASIVVIGGLRALLRVIHERHHLLIMAGGRTRCFIVGANDSGEALLRVIRHNSKLQYRVAGFIDDAERVGTRIDGIPVVGRLAETCERARKSGVSEILITAGELSGRQVRELVDAAQDSELRVKVLPSVEQLLEDRVNIQPRAVVIEDLLRREPVSLDTMAIRRWIDERVIMVTGSAGSIGSEICRQLLELAPERVILVDRSENGQFFIDRELRSKFPGVEIEVVVADITDRERMASVFRQCRPDVVFHAAAYKHVPLMEANPGEGVKNIVQATQIVADLAEYYGTSAFVMVSTDKAVNPTSVMGCCKRVAELYVESKAAVSNCRFVTVRFGNVLDSAGSVVPVFREQIARGGPVSVTHPDMVRFFMTIREASQLVIQAGAMGQGGEIFVLDMGEPVKIVDLANDMIRLSGLRVGEDIEIEIVGVRPGEKLYEELHAEGETHHTTRHQKIMIAEHRGQDPQQLNANIERLLSVVDQQPSPVRSELKNLVPEYQVSVVPETPAVRIFTHDEAIEASPSEKPPVNPAVPQRMAG